MREGVERRGKQYALAAIDSGVYMGVLVRGNECGCGGVGVGVCGYMWVYVGFGCPISQPPNPPPFRARFGLNVGDRHKMLVNATGIAVG